MPTKRTPPKMTSTRRSVLKRIVGAENTIASKNPKITRTDIRNFRQFIKALIPFLIFGTGTVMSIKSTKKAIKGNKK